VRATARSPVSPLHPHQSREDALQPPLNASASTAGALLSSSIFEVPQFQREYSWQEDQVSDFWSDLSKGLDSESYFLGLVILTDEGGRKHVVDGQQRLITLSLLERYLFRGPKPRTSRTC
jgi:uncharacterized protein with ParB-like and HNH nuclease domain